MTLFAAGDSNSHKLLGEERRAMLIDPELRLYAVVNRLTKTTTDNLAVNSMLDTMHRILRANRPLVLRYVVEPSYYNRVRATLFLELAIRQAHRRARLVYKNHGFKANQAPQMIIMVVSDHDALMTLGPAGGIYQVRDGVGRLLTADNAIGHDLMPTAAEVTAPLMQRKHKAARKPTRPGKVKLIHIESTPGDSYLIASDGLATSLGKGSILGEYSLRGAPEAVVKALVKQAGSDGSAGISTGIYLTAKESFNDDFRRLAGQIPELRKFAVFQRMGNFDIVKVLRLMRATDFAKGRAVPLEGPKDERIYLCVSGRFAVHSKGKRIFQIVPGAVIGTAGLVSSFPQTASIVAEEQSRMLFMSADTFRSLRSNEPVVCTKFLWGLSRSLSVSIRKAAEILSTTPVPTPVPKSHDSDETISLVPDDSKNRYIYREPKGGSRKIKIKPKPNTSRNDDTVARG